MLNLPALQRLGLPLAAALTALQLPALAATPPSLPSLPSTAPAAAPAPVPAAPSTTAAVTATREIVLDLTRRTISLLETGKVVRSWPVAIGDPATPTPLGRFKVENKVLNPQYQSTKSGKINNTLGPQGPLGDRWLGFNHSGPNQYGIHGTPSAWSWTVTSRAAVTNGCVRMLTPHVRELFEKVQVGTPVLVKR
jgi:lipoprotein-anchoring transpeptidase ErfK/SrfK